MLNTIVSAIAIIIATMALALGLSNSPKEEGSPEVVQVLSQQEAKILIQDAIAEREQEIIDDLAPQIVIMTKELGTFSQLNVKTDPSSIEELFSPLFKVTTNLGE